LDFGVYLCLWASLTSSFEVHNPSSAAVVAIVLAALLLMVSAFASASEIAFFSLSPSDMSEIDEERLPVDRKIKFLLSDSEQLLTTVLILNNLVNVTIIMLCNYFFAQVFVFHSTVLEFVIMTVVLTFFLLLFGEIMPKIFSAQKSLSFCRFAAPAIGVLRQFFYPLSYAMIHSTAFLNKYFAKKTSQGRNLSVDELSHALELTDKSEISVENNLLEGIIRFGGEEAKDIMTSRLDVITLSINESYAEVMKCIRENVFSRIPVYTGSLDNIKGILYIKDLLPHLGKGNFRWQSLIRPAYFVPETKMIDDLLREFQANKVHIAVVVDEFGGTSGIVTMEDIIEEIVGEIHDEYDDDETNFIELNEHTWIFEAKTQLTDFYKETGLDEDTFDQVEGEADTIAGLLLELKGDFPTIHEKVTYRCYEFEVLAVDSRRIKKVKFTIKPTSEDYKDKAKDLKESNQEKSKS
jgi:putative hemolysin